MKTIVFAIVVALCGVVSDAFAAARIVWIPNAVTIKAIRSYGQGNTGHFIFINDASYWEGCTGTQQSGIYYFPSNSDDAYRMLLLAKIADRTVRLSVQGYEFCTGSYAIIKEVQLGEN